MRDRIILDPERSGAERSLARRTALLATLLGLAAVPALAGGRALHQFREVAIAPDGRHVAAIEQDDLPSDTAPPLSLLIHDLSGGVLTVALPCQPGPNCKVASPGWSADGHRLAFLIGHDRDNTAEIDEVDAGGGAVRRILSFDGPLDALRFGPDDRLAVLATSDAHKRVGRAQSSECLTG